MVEFSGKIRRLKALQKNLFKRKGAKLPNHEDAGSTKQGSNSELVVTTLAFQEPAIAEDSSAVEERVTQFHTEDEGSVGIDENEQHSPAIPQTEGEGSALETTLQDNRPELDEVLPFPDVPFMNVGSSSVTPQNLSAVQPELRNNDLLSPISEESAIDVAKLKAAQNPSREALHERNVTEASSDLDRLSPLIDGLANLRGEIQPENGSPLYALSKEWMADDLTVTQRTISEHVTSNGSTKSGGNQGDGFAAGSMSEPVAVDLKETQYPDTTLIHDHNGRTSDVKEDPYLLQDVQPAPLGNGTPFTLGGDKRLVNIDVEDPKVSLKQFGKQVVSGPAFTGAHGFVINNPVFLDVPRSTTKAMKLLYRKALPNTSLDSDARSPPPVCLEGTRVGVRTRILTWVADRNRVSNLLWLYGPAGAGTSAVAQTVAEYCKAQGWLGAAFFFPRVLQQLDRTRVIPSLAYQLAAALPAYRNYITSILDLDRSILEGSLRTQFQKLILEPLSIINVSAAVPKLILLDGLNNLKDNIIQRELIESIGRFAVKANYSGLPFIWIIASRRERNIISAFETATPPILHQREELRINTQDAKQDVSKFVRYGFQKIRQTHYYVVSDGNTWPAEDHLSTINATSSGLFAFASSILDFVDSDNPVAKLQDCLKFLKDHVIPQSGNPLQLLHSIYQEVLSDVPRDIFPLTKRILSFLAFGAQEIPFRVVADFLALDQPALYGGLLRLHSVLDVPAPVNSTNSPLLILHTSLKDFVKDRIKSGDFELDLQVTAPNTAARIEELCFKRYIQWRNEGLHGVLPPPWYCMDPESNVMKFLMRELWVIWCSKSKEEIPKLCTTLRQFSFPEYDHVSGKLEKLAPVKDVERHITKLLHVLSDWQDEHGRDDYPIFRSEPKCTTDKKLLKQYQFLVNHARVKKIDFYRSKPASECWSYKIFSLNADERSGPRECPNMLRVFSTSQPVYFLLGYDTNTCLVIAYQAV